MRHNRYFIAATMFLSSVCRTANADYIVASNLPAAQESVNSWEEVGLITPAENYNNKAPGQSFTPTANGILTTIDALFSSAFDQPNPPDSPPLNISLYTALNSAPGALLATVQKHSSDFPHLSGGGDHRSTIDFTQFQIPLVAGQHYFVEFETPIGVVGGSGPNAPYFVGRQQNPSPPFALGEFSSVAPNHTDWQIDSTAELAITVHEIPEPSTVALLSIAAAIACGVRRAYPAIRAH
jgi:hypothetical protein